MRSITLIFVFVISSIICFPQAPVEVKGTITDYFSGKTLTDVKITLLKNQKDGSDYFVDQNGQVDINLEYDQSYLLTINKEGFVSKRISIDTRNIPVEEKETGNFKIPFKMSLFKEMEGIDFRILDSPIGAYQFKEEDNDIVYDENQTASTLIKVKELMKQYDKQVKKERRNKGKSDDTKIEPSKQPQAKPEPNLLPESVEDEPLVASLSDKPVLNNNFRQTQYQKRMQEIAEQNRIRIKRNDSIIAARKLQRSKHLSDLDQKSRERRQVVNTEIKSRPITTEKSSDEYNLTDLARDYPQGATEEIYETRNSKNEIIKITVIRIVVDGNRANKYKKVHAKWGTFYFKNGQNITEHIWIQETEIEND